MIVLHRDGQLLLMKQLDHAGLAGRFAEEWGSAVFAAPEPADAVVLAAARHDEGWRESDDAVRYDPARHAPLYFLDGSIQDYVDLYARGIQRIAELNPYAGLLVSMHGTGNVCGRWGMQPGMRLSGYDERTWPQVIERFVLEQEALQSRLKLRLVGLQPVQRRSVFERRLWANWEMLQVWDRLSLFACRTDPAGEAEVEVGHVPTSLDGMEMACLKASALGAGRLAVEPWPFRKPSFEVAVPLIRIEDRPYEGQEDVSSAAAGALPERLSWTFAAA